ncbi:MAG: BON domain-containing protein [Terriglobales bacterium]
MRKSVSIVPSLSLILVLLGSFGSLWAQDATQTQQPTDQGSQAAPDNTTKNQRDRSKSEPTADQQKENKSDRELAQQIRRALVKDESLSTYAHNIKVIAQNGEITLKGPVKSAEEKQAVEAKAAEVAGAAHRVKSEIEVAGK